MVATWRRSWGLVRLSWRILRQDTFLALYPLIAFGMMLVLGFVALLIFGMMVAIVGAYHDSQFDLLTLSPIVQLIGILFLGVVVWGIIIIATYSQVALAGALQRGFAGMSRSLRDGFVVANARWRGIVEYSAISAVVGVIVILLRAIVLLPRTDAAGAGFASLFYFLVLMTWSIITCLVAPIVAAENTSGIDAIRRSRELLRFTWGRLISGWIWLGFWLFLAMVVVVFGSLLLSSLMMLVAHTVIVEVFSEAIFFIALAGLVFFYNAMGNIFAVTLYQDAGAGVRPAPPQPMLAPSLAVHATQFGNIQEGHDADALDRLSMQPAADRNVRPTVQGIVRPTVQGKVRRPIASHRYRPRRG